VQLYYSSIFIIATREAFRFIWNGSRLPMYTSLSSAMNKLSLFERASNTSTGKPLISSAYGTKTTLNTLTTSWGSFTIRTGHRCELYEQGDNVKPYTQLHHHVVRSHHFEDMTFVIQNRQIQVKLRRLSSDDRKLCGRFHSSMFQENSPESR
jgi:hypothetical protein